MRAIDFCLELGMQKMVFEGDALVLIQALKEEVECMAWYKNLIKEAKLYFKTQNLLEHVV